MSKKQLYIAGDMLQKGNQLLRAIERVELEKLGTVDVFNPADQKDINDKSSNPQAEQIFAKDTSAILGSEIVVSDISNLYTGTVAEMGQIWGVNYVLHKLHHIIAEADRRVARMVENGVIHGQQAKFDARNKIIAQELELLLLAIPVKQVHWQTTDIRDTLILEAGHRRSHSLNQYLYGMMLDMAGEAKPFDSILEELKEC